MFYPVCPRVRELPLPRGAGGDESEVTYRCTVRTVNETRGMRGVLAARVNILPPVSSR